LSLTTLSYLGDYVFRLSVCVQDTQSSTGISIELGMTVEKGPTVGTLQQYCKFDPSNVTAE